MPTSLLKECTGEFVGTWLLVFLGTAAVTTAVTTGAQVGLWQTAVVWGIAITSAISVASQVSEAHLNPAVTISLAVSRHAQFPLKKVVPYIAAQLLGATLSGICVLAVYGSAISRFEDINYITRGEANSTLSAMAFGEYFPNPQIVVSGVLRTEDVTPFGAMLVEAAGTLVLMLMIRTLSDEKNKGRPRNGNAAIYIGITASALVSVFAPLSQAGFNPARDFGPRVVAACAGWGRIALPGPRGGFWVYILGPILGALVGGFLYDYAVYPSLTKPRISKEKLDAATPEAEEPIEARRGVQQLMEASVDVVDIPRTDSPRSSRASSPPPSRSTTSPHCTRAVRPHVVRASSPRGVGNGSPRTVCGNGDLYYED